MNGAPVAAVGAGMLVAPGTATFVLHDHVMVGRVPAESRAFASYKFAARVRVTKVVIVQHTNGIDEIELFSGTTSCGKSRGTAPNGQVTAPGIGLQEHVAYDYTGFSTSCPESTGKSFQN